MQRLMVTLDIFSRSMLEPVLVHQQVFISSFFMLLDNIIISLAIYVQIMAEKFPAWVTHFGHSVNRKNQTLPMSIVTGLERVPQINESSHGGGN